VRKNNGTTIDLTGQAFGLLTVVERAPNDKFGRVYWRCMCRCGASALKCAHQLRAGKFFTCGAPACRFWEKVYIPDAADALCPSPLGWCWEWTGALKETGYGVFKQPGEKKTLRAHVFSWELHNGPIEDALWALHKCDNRKCVRPTHLFLGTHDDNMRDMAQKGRVGLQRVFLSETQKKQIVLDYQQGGLTHPDLAARYNVSLATVGRVLRRGPHKEHLS